MKTVAFSHTVIFFVISHFCEAQREEGAQCQSFIGLGTCVSLTNCQSALDRIEFERKSPDFCNPDSYENFNALVCCVEQRHGVKLRERVSLQKCKQYHPKIFIPDQSDTFYITVVRGRKALSKEYPHMALLGYGTEDEVNWLCGGSLISEKFVVTAAHCIHTNRGSPIIVRLGELDTASSTDDADPTDFKIARLLAHPEYRSPSNYHDIGLIELNSVVTFNDYIKPICLHQGDAELHFLSAAGWGDTAFLGNSSAHLMVVDLKFVNNSACNRFYNGKWKKQLPYGIVDKLQICVGGNDGKDTCQGDSGGPLQVDRPELGFHSFVDKVYDLVGITSFGTGCGLGNIPGVYTRVSTYLDWIEPIVWP